MTKFSNLQKGILVSLCLHLFILGVMNGFDYHSPPSTRIDIEILATPQVPLNPQTLTKPIIIPTQRTTKANPKARPVTGLNKNSVVENAVPDAPEVKAGNTLSQAPDDLKMGDEDENLPTPAEEYQVSNWPQLKNDVRIPYPREAKSRGLEGTVVMDLYINAAGQVKKANLVSGPGLGLNEAALEAAKTFQFSPAFVDAKAVPVVIRYSYRFVIQK